MFLGRRMTLLIIPEGGGRTHEFKIRRISVWFFAVLGVCMFVLLGFGAQAHMDATILRERVDGLARDKEILEGEVALVRSLERTLTRLQSTNVQLINMLTGVSVETSDEGAESVTYSRYISATNRLQGGLVRTVPSLWPVRGVMKEPYTADRPGVVISAREGSLIRASANGKVVEISFDETLGHVIVLDHGSGISSLYGHAATLLVEVGRYVRKGQPIALCGRAADGHGAVYFSVRENGEYRDPLRYRLWL